MKKIVLVGVLLFCYLLISAQSQNINFDFGDIKPADLAPQSYAIDRDAAAVYLFDIGSTRFNENNSIVENEEVYERHARIRLLDKSAFGLATIELYVRNTEDIEDKQSLEDLQAVTYNLENGKVVSQSVDKKSVFIEKENGVNTTKLTLPAVKVGSIIEFYYTIRTQGIHIPHWDFQSRYPVLWSEYEVVIPFFYDYALFKQGLVKFAVDSSVTYHVDYNYHQYQPNEPNTLKHVWRAENIPAIKNESFMSSIDNYKARIDFQLSAYKNRDGKKVAYGRDWNDVGDQLRNYYAFGYELKESYSWMRDKVKQLTEDLSSPLQKAKAIYAYVRGNFKCIDYDEKYISQEMKDTYQSKNGNVADINLMLVAMLRHTGIAVDPVLISTRDNGRLSYSYPALSKFNYVIAMAKIENVSYLLDASDKDLSFGKIDAYCYNGAARIIDPDSTQLLNLSADSLKEGTIATAFVINDSEYKSKATITNSMSYQPSLSLRKELNATNTKNYFKNISSLSSDQLNISNETIEGLKSQDSDLVVKYDIVWQRNNEDIIYFNPFFINQTKENPFAAATREYPVEMPYCKEETYLLTMDIPTNYTIDEMPKSAKVKLNETEGSFEYLIGVSGNKIQMRVHLKLERATYEPEDYQTLRDFYAFVVKKEAEQIVFKKLK